MELERIASFDMNLSSCHFGSHLYAVAVGATQGIFPGLLCSPALSEDGAPSSKRFDGSLSSEPYCHVAAIDDGVSIGRAPPL